MSSESGLGICFIYLSSCFRIHVSKVLQFHAICQGFRIYSCIYIRFMRIFISLHMERQSPILSKAEKQMQANPPTSIAN